MARRSAHRAERDRGFASAPLGLQHRVDLTSATSRGEAIDLRLTIADAAGNTTTLTLEPACVILAPPGKRRAITPR